MVHTCVKEDLSKNPPIVLVRLHPGKFCCCYWQTFFTLHVIQGSRYFVTLRGNKCWTFRKHSLTRLSAHHPFLCLMSTNGSCLWPHLFLSCLVLPDRNRMGIMAKHAPFHLWGVPLEEQRFVPFSDWIEQCTDLKLFYLHVAAFTE